MRPPAVDRAGSLQTGTPEMFSRGAVAVAPMRFIPTMVSTAPRASRACRRLRVRCRAVWSELPNASGQPAQVLRSTVERAAGILAFEPPSWQAFVCPQGVAQPKSSSWWTRRESPCSEAPLIILDGDCHGFRGWRIPNRIYARSSAAPRKLVDLADLWSAQPASSDVPAALRPTVAQDVNREVDRLVLAEFAPPGVVVTDSLAIVQFRGRTGPFLDPAAGVASFDLLRMVREELRLPLRQTIDEARAKKVLARRTVPVPAPSSPGRHRPAVV